MRDLSHHTGQKKKVALDFGLNYLLTKKSCASHEGSILVLKTRKKSRGINVHSGDHINSTHLLHSASSLFDASKAERREQEGEPECPEYVSNVSEPVKNTCQVNDNTSAREVRLQILQGGDETVDDVVEAVDEPVKGSINVGDERVDGGDDLDERDESDLDTLCRACYQSASESVRSEG